MASSFSPVSSRLSNSIKSNQPGLDIVLAHLHRSKHQNVVLHTRELLAHLSRVLSRLTPCVSAHKRGLSSTYHHIKYILLLLFILFYFQKMLGKALWIPNVDVASVCLHVSSSLSALPLPPLPLLCSELRPVREVKPTLRLVPCLTYGLKQVLPPNSTPPHPC